MEEKKKEKLLELRKDLLTIAMEEKDREIETLKTKFKTEKEKIVGDNTRKQEILRKLEERSTATSNDINKRLNKKVSFYLQEVTDIKFTKKKRLLKQRRKKPEHVKKKNRQNHRRNTKIKKNEQMQNRIQKIKDENIVVNLSEEEVPASTYLYLAKGLGFVPTRKVDIQDLRYDTIEFIREMKWKAFFHHNPEARTDVNNNTEHADIKVSTFSEAPFQHPLMDELKDKLLGWITSHQAKTPKNNLTQLELRGKKWLEEKIQSKKVFVTKADKGGAILVLNYKDVEDAVEK